VDGPGLTGRAWLWPSCCHPAGWRDPFVLERPSAGSPWWYVMVGAGVRDKCGTALVYRSQDLTEGGSRIISHFIQVDTGGPWAQ
jgi:hypothetical protein